MAEIIIGDLRGITGVIGAAVGKGVFGTVSELLAFDGTVKAVKVFNKATDDLEKRLRRLAKQNAPHHAFKGWPLDITRNKRGQLCVIMQLVRPPSRPLPDLIRDLPSVPMRTRAILACLISDALEALAIRGMAFNDLAPQQVLVNLQSVLLDLVDCDNVAISGCLPFVVGTPGCMSPQSMLGREPMSLATDAFALGVLVFLLLICIHPLLGIREEQRTFLDREAYQQLFAVDPLFVFARDPSNRPGKTQGLAPIRSWNQLPRKIRHAFTKNFTVGLLKTHDCVFASDWRRMMASLVDAAFQCDCSAELFADSAKFQQKCWQCGTLVQRPRRIAIRAAGRTSRLILRNESELYSHHLSGRRPSFDFSVIGRIVHGASRRSHFVGIENLTSSSWLVRCGTDRLTIAPGQTAALPIGAGHCFPSGVEGGIAISAA